MLFGHAGYFYYFELSSHSLFFYFELCGSKESFLAIFISRQKCEGWDVLLLVCPSVQCFWLWCRFMKPLGFVSNSTSLLQKWEMWITVTSKQWGHITPRRVLYILIHNLTKRCESKHHTFLQQVQNCSGDTLAQETLSPYSPLKSLIHACPTCSPRATRGLGWLCMRPSTTS